MTVAGQRWHVQVAGTGPVLLLLHGTGAATHSWRDLLPLLAAHFTVIAPDLPGHGFTTPGAKTLPGMARAVEALIAALALTPELIVGHSAGAAIGIRLALAAKIPPKALVGLSAALLPFPGLAARLFPTLAKLLFVNPFVPLILSRLARTPGEVGRFLPRSTGSSIDKKGVDYYARLFAKPGHIAGAIGMMASWELEQLERDLPAVKLPLLLMHGDRDAAIPIPKAREAAALVPRAKLEALAGLGHLAHEEAPQRVAEAVEAFARESGMRFN